MTLYKVRKCRKKLHVVVGGGKCRPCEREYGRRYYAKKRPPTMAPYPGLAEELAELGVDSTPFALLAGLSCQTVINAKRGEKLHRRTRENISSALDDIRSGRVARPGERRRVRITNLQKILDQLGTTQKSFAREAGMHPSNIQRAAAGKKVWVGTAEKIVAAVARLKATRPTATPEEARRREEEIEDRLYNRRTQKDWEEYY